MRKPTMLQSEFVRSIAMTLTKRAWVLKFRDRIDLTVLST